MRLRLKSHMKKDVWIKHVAPIIQCTVIAEVRCVIMHQRIALVITQMQWPWFSYLMPWNIYEVSTDQFTIQGSTPFSNQMNIQTFYFFNKMRINWSGKIGLPLVFGIWHSNGGQEKDDHLILYITYIHTHNINKIYETKRFEMKLWTKYDFSKDFCKYDELWENE